MLPYSLTASALITTHSCVCVCRCVLSTAERECERQKDKISFAPAANALSKPIENLKTARTHSHTQVNTCFASFNSPVIHYQLNGSESPGKKRGASKPLPRVQKGALTLGQEATRSSLCGGWRVGRSHKSTVFDRDVTGCVCRPHSSLISRVLHTTKRTHTCFTSCPWNPGRTRCDPSLTGPASFFPHLKASKTPVFHTSNFTHALHIPLPAFRDCVSHTGLSLEAPFLRELQRDR